MFREKYFAFRFSTPGKDSQLYLAKPIGIFGRESSSTSYFKLGSHCRPDQLDQARSRQIT